MKPLTRKEALVNAYVTGTLDKVKPVTRDEAIRKMELEKSSTVVVHITGGKASGFTADMGHREVCNLVKQGYNVICEVYTEDWGTPMTQRLYLGDFADVAGLGELVYTFESPSPQGFWVSFTDGDITGTFDVGMKAIQYRNGEIEVSYSSILS